MVGLGDGEGEVAVPLLLLQAPVDANATSRTMDRRSMVGMNALTPRMAVILNRA